MTRSIQIVACVAPTGLKEPESRSKYVPSFVFSIHRRGRRCIDSAVDSGGSGRGTGDLTGAPRDYGGLVDYARAGGSVLGELARDAVHGRRRGDTGGRRHRGQREGCGNGKFGYA